MRVLVTGATGFTGGHLARSLARDGQQVRVLARPSVRAAKLEAEGFEVVPGDLSDRPSVELAAAGAEVIFHVAAMYRTAAAADSGFFEINVEGTRNLLNAALRAGTRRVVHVSTVGVHGHIAKPPADETYPFGPRDAYQQSKCEGERVAESFRSRGLEVAIVRPVGIFGPGDTRFLKLFRGVARRRFVLLGAGTNLYQMTFIDDLVRGMRLCAERPEAAGQTFIIAGPPAVPVKVLVAQVALAVKASKLPIRLPLWPFQLVAPVVQAACRAVNVEPPLYPRRLEFFSDSRSFSTEKAKRLLGYEPRISLEEGLGRAAQWYREQGWL